MDSYYDIDEICCVHCGASFQEDEVGELTVTIHGTVCRSCICSRCEKLKDLRCMYNTIEVLDETYESVGDSYFCSTCFSNFSLEKREC